MAPPETAEGLLALVRRSDLVPERVLRDFLGRLGPAGVPDDPRACADLLVRDRVLTHFQAEQLLRGRFLGFGLGKYRILECIGVGGMGQVFLCRHEGMKRQIAVKVLPRVKSVDEVAVGRFYREARLSASLDHPNIVRAFDVDSDRTRHYLVMEYVEGVSLRDMVQGSGPLAPARAAACVAEAAAGLQHAFECGIVHRDVKPGNFIVDRAGAVKVLDLGLARLLDDEADDLTQRYDGNCVLGTVDYVAPEQVSDSHGADVRADVYGLGATFYYLLAGHPPFPDGEYGDKLLAHQRATPRPIRELRPDVPAGLAAVLDRMLMKNPDARFQTPAEVIAALAPWRGEVPLPDPALLPRLSPLAVEGADWPMTPPEPHVPARPRGAAPSGKPPRPVPSRRTAEPAPAGAGVSVACAPPPPRSSAPAPRVTDDTHPVAVACHVTRTEARRAAGAAGAPVRGPAGLAEVRARTVGIVAVVGALAGGLLYFVAR